jgi:glycosyltransferase involved in cell wall biosynthesis
MGHYFAFYAVKEMGERARKMVLEKYTWEKNAEKTMKVYKEVFNNAR